jgi:hypothetical protein
LLRPAIRSLAELPAPEVGEPLTPVLDAMRDDER